ncbi:MAG: ATP-binding protein, partial [Bacteroidota bacterium]
LLQDREGFLWVGTKNGLNRYDGHGFEWFTAKVASDDALANDWVTDLIELGDFILIATHSAELSFFHKPTRRFYTLSLKDHLAQPEVDVVARLLLDEQGDIWVNTRPTQTLLRLRLPAQFSTSFPSEDSLLSQIQIQSILNGTQWIAAIDSNRLAIRQAGEVKILDKRKLQVVEAAPTSIWGKLTKEAGFNAQPGLVQDKTHLLVKRKDVWYDYQAAFLIGFAFYDAAQDQLWVQDQRTLTTYLYRLGDLPPANLLDYDSAAVILGGEKRGIVRAISDKNSILWLGTNGYGLQKVPPRSLAIEQYLTGQSIYDYPYTVAGGEILLNQLRGRLYYEAGRSGRLSEIYNYLTPLDYGKTFKIVHWEEEKHWLAKVQTEGTDTEGYVHSLDLLLLDQQGLKLHHQVVETDTTEHLVFNLAMGNDQKTLLVILQNKWVVLDIASGDQQSYRTTFPINPRFQWYNAVQTTNGDWWMGTNLGMVHASLNDEQSPITMLNTQNSGLLHNDCASLLIHPDNGNQLWIGTKGGGLHHLDIENSMWTYVNTSTGLPNDVIYAVLADEEHQLWMSSNQGLINYDSPSGAIRQFTREDGLQSNEFNTFAYSQASDGRMYFGGVNGLNSFYPADLAERDQAVEARITSLAINNQAVLPTNESQLLGQDIILSKEIKLDYAQNNIQLAFAAMDFTAPEKTRFQYYLQGLERPWEHETKDQRATYLNVPSGRYTFQLKATNADGIWSTTITSLDIVIYPPWYRTWWAYLLYLALTLLLLSWYLRQQQKRLELRHRIAMEQREAERLREAESFRTRLYNNLTHEFRTPLTVILGVADQLKKGLENQQLHPKLSLLRRNANNLLELVNQQLNLAKKQQQTQALEVVHDDFGQYLRLLLEDFQPIAQERNISLVLKGASEPLLINYDPEKMRQIVANLVSNALKYTDAGGAVSVSIATIANNQLELVVKDTGKGIAPAELPFVFDRFYQSAATTDTAHSSGLGLSVVKESVELLGGTITAESQVEKGSTFKVQLPVLQDRLVSTPSQNKHHPLPSITKQTLAEPQDRTRPLLLLIEDHADVMTFLQSCFEDTYDLTFAYDGSAGITQALEHIPDLIISDVMMPHKSGYELCEALKLDQRTSHIPIILLTAKVDAVSRITGFRRGADAYIGKPFQQEELLLQVHNLLQLRRSWQLRYQSLEATPTTTDDELLQQEDTFILKVKAIVEAHLEDEEFDTQKLCREVGMSRSQLHLKLKALTGKSTSLFVRSIRLHEAKRLLRHSEMNITEVAYAVGFSHRSYFSRAFSEEFGLSPKQYKERGG